MADYGFAHLCAKLFQTYKHTVNVNVYVKIS